MPTGVKPKLNARVGNRHKPTAEEYRRMHYQQVLSDYDRLYREIARLRAENKELREQIANY